MTINIIHDHIKQTGVWYKCCTWNKLW